MYNIKCCDAGKRAVRPIFPKTNDEAGGCGYAGFSVEIVRFMKPGGSHAENYALLLRQRGFCGEK